MSKAAPQDTRTPPAVILPKTVQSAGAHYVYLYTIGQKLEGLSDEQHSVIMDAKAEVAREIAGLPATTLQDLRTKMALIDEDRSTGETELTCTLLEAVGRDILALMKKAEKNGWAL